MSQSSYIFKKNCLSNYYLLKGRVGSKSVHFIKLLNQTKKKLEKNILEHSVGKKIWNSIAK